MINKKIKKGFITTLSVTLITAGGIFQSCDFLDIDPYITDLTTLDTVFHKREYAEKYLRNIYSYQRDRTNVIGVERGLPGILITDEGLCGHKYGKENHPYNYYANNEVTADNLYAFDGYWEDLYEAIRKSSTFIQRINECTEATATQRAEWIAEARFLRASFYFDLMLMFGPVPIMPDKPMDFDTPIHDMMIPRSTWDECSNYVASELEKAIASLPDKVFSTSEVGKPTKASGLAVLSRLTLYTASRLFNGNGEFADFVNKQGVPYINPNYDEKKWVAAAAAAQRLVEVYPVNLYTVPKMANTPDFPVPEAEKAAFPNGVGGIDPYHSFVDLFSGAQQLSAVSEILYSKPYTYKWDGTTHMGYYCAPAIINGYGIFALTQNLADAFYMIDGRTIDNPSTQYPHENQKMYTDVDVTFSGAQGGDGYTILAGTHKWYVNREMRFYATVGYCNSEYPSLSNPADKLNPIDKKVAKFYKDGQSGQGRVVVEGTTPEDYPMTGYLCRKFLHYEDSFYDSGRIKPKYSILYRMAEIYLNYVEAMNELTESHTINGVTVFRNTAEMKRCFNLIRYRAGLPGITENDVNDVQRMRDLIARERQVEFAWEGHRYYDLRRTKTAVTYENADVMGCDVSKKSTEKDLYYQKVRVKERSYTYKVFTRRQTFFPIPKREIKKNDNLDQFPGY